MQRDGVPDPLGLLAGQASVAGDPAGGASDPAGGVGAGDLEPNMPGRVDGVRPSGYRDGVP